MKTRRENEMGKSTKWLVAIAALMTTPVIAGEKGEFQVTPFLGSAHLRVDAAHVEEGRTRRMDALLAGLNLGYRAPFGLTVELGRSDASHKDLIWWFTDGLSLRQYYGALGYQFEAGKWRFTPKVGRSRWRLHASNFDLLDGAGEDLERLRGYDNFVEASAARRLGQSMAMGVTLRALEADFGRSGDAALTFTWTF
jgi:hypothetical protein